MKDKELSKKEKLEQENFLLESKIILKGGDIHRCSDIDPEIENQFMKNIIAFEEAELKPLYEIIDVNPDDFPPAEKLSKDEINSKFNLLIKCFEDQGFSYDVSDKVPVEVSYRFLTEDYLHEPHEVLPDNFGWHIDGCSGDCPSCFQVNYCDSVNDIWTPEELKKEQKRRLLEG